LRTVLAHHAHLKLPNGGYLFLKNCQSSRALNQTRIARAVNALTPEQCVVISQENASWSAVKILSEALADNLDAECVVRTTTPAITKKAPTGEMPWKTAPPTVVAQAERFTHLHEQLSVMRKHRTTGKKRAAAVQAAAEPVVQAYLQEHDVSRQVVQFGGPALADLPALPVLPAPLSNLPALPDLPAVPAVLPGAGDGQKVMFATRTYTTRGKAPSLNAFIDALPALMAPFAQQGLAQIPTLKKDILKVLLDLFREKYEAQQGSVKKRLVVKAL